MQSIFKDQFGHKTHNAHQTIALSSKLQTKKPVQSDFSKESAPRKKQFDHCKPRIGQVIIWFMNYMLTLANISGDTWSEDIADRRKVLGRAEGAEIRLDHASVSRQHCAFWMENGQSWIEDCGSTNGTYVNGIKVQREKLNPGDTIVVGRFELIVEERSRIQATLNLPEVPVSRQVIADQRAEERHLAKVIHERLTPSRKLSLTGMIAEVVYHPSGMLGGDTFDTAELENRWILSIFDPMTHGVKATLNSMLLRAELQRWIALTEEPARCLQWINTELAILNVNDLYISATVASWFPRIQTLVYSAAGEHPPLIMREGAPINLGEMAGGLPLGVSPSETFSEQIFQLKTGDRIYFFTDGMGELISRHSQGSPAAVELAKRLHHTWKMPLGEQLHAVLPDDFGHLIDDILFVGCEVTTS
jgi:serine phosphatase RsbU (regulator of sigma subunit)